MIAASPTCVEECRGDSHGNRWTTVDPASTSPNTNKLTSMVHSCADIRRSEYRLRNRRKVRMLKRCRSVVMSTERVEASAFTRGPKQIEVIPQCSEGSTTDPPCPAPSLTRFELPMKGDNGFLRERRDVIDGVPCGTGYSPAYLRKRTIMLDGPPRGRSIVALRDRDIYNTSTKKRSRSRSRPRPIGLTTYPPYIPIPGIFQSQQTSNSCTRMELIRGDTCRLIMYLMSEYRTIKDVVDQLPYECDSDDVMKWDFEAKDVEAIVKRCREHGLTARTPLEAQDWEYEDVHEWWRDPSEGGMEEGWRDDPVGLSETGDLSVMVGWWTNVSTQRWRLSWKRS
jgi:hypothetical protein